MRVLPNSCVNNEHKNLKLIRFLESFPEKPVCTIAIIWQKETMIQWAGAAFEEARGGGREAWMFLTAMKTISSIWTWDCHHNRDFCHHNRDSKIPTGVADFSNGLHQKLIKSQWKEEGAGGRRRAHIPIEVAEFWIQTLYHFYHFKWKYGHFCCFFFSRHCKKTTEMIRGEKRLHLKFCHLNRDVRAPARPCTLLFSQWFD